MNTKVFLVLAICASGYSSAMEIDEHDLQRQLLTAVISGNAAATHSLVSAGVNPDFFYQDKTPLMLAALKNCPEVIKVLLHDDRCDTLTPDKHGRTALWHAADKGHVECVRVLIPREPDEIYLELNAADYYGEMPLARALLNKHKKVVTCLVTQGAAVEPAMMASLQEVMAQESREPSPAVCERFKKKWGHKRNSSCPM